MSTEVFDAQRRLRERWDDLARVYTAWNEDGVETTQRMFTSAENAVADEAAAVVNKDKNRVALLDRLADANATLRGIVNASSFNNSQRDETLRYLARVCVAQNRLIEGMAGRLAALDSTE